MLTLNAIGFPSTLVFPIWYILLCKVRKIIEWPAWVCQAALTIDLPPRSVKKRGTVEYEQDEARATIGSGLPCAAYVGSQYRNLWRE
jgi:hypothetical protein